MSSADTNSAEPRVRIKETADLSAQRSSRDNAKPETGVVAEMGFMGFETDRAELMSTARPFLAGFPRFAEDGFY